MKIFLFKKSLFIKQRQFLSKLGKVKINILYLPLITVNEI